MSSNAMVVLCDGSVHPISSISKISPIFKYSSHWGVEGGESLDDITFVNNKVISSKMEVTFGEEDPIILSGSEEEGFMIASKSYPLLSEEDPGNVNKVIENVFLNHPDKEFAKKFSKRIRLLAKKFEAIKDLNLRIEQSKAASLQENTSILNDSSDDDVSTDELITSLGLEKDAIKEILVNIRKSLRIMNEMAMVENLADLYKGVGSKLEWEKHDGEKVLVQTDEKVDFNIRDFNGYDIKETYLDYLNNVIMEAV